MKTLAEQAREMEQKRGELKNLFETHVAKDAQGNPVLDAEGKKQFDMDADKIAEVNRRNDELATLGKSYEEARRVQRAAEDNEKALSDLGRPVNAAPYPDGAGGSNKPVKGLGDLFVESKAFKGYRQHQTDAIPDVDLKTLFQTSAGWAPFVQRQDRVVLSAQQMPKVVDLLPKTTTGQAGIKYMEETTYTSGVAETAEAGTYAESAFALTERSVMVQKITGALSLTDEELEDVDRVRDYVNNRLTLQLRQRLDKQILQGDGTGNNLLGIYNKSGIQTIAQGTDPITDVLYKAMVKVMTVGFTDPTAYILHPLDWQTIRLLRTQDGLYIWGHPSDSGPERIWGLPVVKTTFATQTTAVCGDFEGFSELAMRKGIEFQITNSHQDYFFNGKQALRADMRCALLWLRAAAFCTATSLH